MQSRIYNRLRGRTSRQALIFLFIAVVVMTFILIPAFYPRIEQLSGGYAALDTLFAYTPDQAYNIIGSYGAPAAELYLRLLLTFDIVFPLVYGLFFSMLIVQVYDRLFARHPFAQRLVYVPILTALADLAENISIAVLLNAYPQRLDILAGFASLMTTAKWVGLYATIGVLVIGLVWLFIRYLRNRNAS